MGPAEDVDTAAKASPLFAKYGTRVDAESARELLAARLQQAATGIPAQPTGDTRQPAPEPEAAGVVGGGVGPLGAFLKSRQGQRLEKQVVRGVFGLLKKKF